MVVLLSHLNRQNNAKRPRRQGCHRNTKGHLAAIHTRTPSEPWKKITAYIKKCHIQKDSYVLSGYLLMTKFVQNRSHARIFNLEEFGQRIVHNWIATNIELKLHSHLIQLIRFLNILSHKIYISRPIYSLKDQWALSLEWVLQDIGLLP